MPFLGTLCFGVEITLPASVKSHTAHFCGLAVDLDFLFVVGFHF
jgi:hypothetical protein